jgi:ATP-dependent HslUV protease ATP-binding subunit HslU
VSALTPSQIVAELDRYIVGQHRAKRAVAIALRNRWRRQNLPPELRDEVAPKNIIMIGPTGWGRRRSRAASPAGPGALPQGGGLQVHRGRLRGRDVESMIRDLTELSVNMVKAEMAAEVRERAEAAGEDRLLDLLLPRGAGSRSLEHARGDRTRRHPRRTREKLRAQLRGGSSRTR